MNSGLKRLVLWDYPRGVWQYDVAVAIIIGFIFLADNFDIIHFERIGELWPLALVGVGIWMLRRHQGKAAS